MKAKVTEQFISIPGIGEIPDSWTVSKIGEVGLQDTPVVKTGPFGAQLRSKDFRTSGVPVLNIGNVQPGYFDLTKLDHVSVEKAEQLSAYFLNEGDLVFSRSASIGRTACCTKEMAGWLLSYHLMRLSIDKNRCCPRFLMFSLMFSPVIVNQVNAITQGGTRSGINTAILENLRIAFPDLPAQKSIVAVVDAIDLAVETTRAVVDQTRKLKAALLHDLLTRGLPGKHQDFTEHPRMGSFPSAWKLTSLDELASLVTSGSRGWSRFVSDKGAFFVRSQNIGAGVVLFDDVISVAPLPGQETDRARIRNGDLLISVTGDPGNVCYFNGQTDIAYVSQHVALVRLKNPSLAAWITLALTSQNGKAQFQSLTYGQTRPGLGLDNIFELFVPLPEPDEQQAICKLINDTQTRIEAEENKLKQFKVLKATLSQGLLTGRIPVVGVSSV